MGAPVGVEASVGETKQHLRPRGNRLVDSKITSRDLASFFLSDENFVRMRSIVDGSAHGLEVAVPYTAWVSGLHLRQAFEADHNNATKAILWIWWYIQRALRFLDRKSARCFPEWRWKR